LAEFGKTLWQGKREKMEKMEKTRTKTGREKEIKEKGKSAETPD